MLWWVRLSIVAVLGLFITANAASIKSMVASQQTQKIGTRDKNLLTYVSNVPEHIQRMMMHKRFRR